jgi:hypothetical protein
VIRALVYAGPSLERLHDDYAKRGRIDDRAPIAVTHGVLIDAPVSVVWAVLADPRGWAAVDPVIHDVRLAEPVGVDVEFRWKSGSASMRSRFAVVEPEREITWTGSSFGAKVVHRHLLEPVDAGTTRLTCEESMAGPLLGLFFSSAKLRTHLDRWLTAVKAAAERRAVSG